MLIPHVFAQGVDIPNPLSCDTAVACVQGLLNGLILLAIPVASIMILVGGFQIMFANGSEEKVSQGKKTIIYACVGFGCIVLSSGVTAIIQDFLS